MKLSKRQKEAEARRHADLSAQGAGRTDIDYETDELPTSHILAREAVKLKDKPESASKWLSEKVRLPDPTSSPSVFTFERVVGLLEDYLIDMTA